MRRNEDDSNRAVLGWKPTEKRPRGRLRKRWLDIVDEDLDKIGTQDRREKWRDLVIAMNSLSEY